LQVSGSGGGRVDDVIDEEESFALDTIARRSTSGS
jgi:hypothetical protein